LDPISDPCVASVVADLLGHCGPGRLEIYIFIGAL